MENNPLYVLRKKLGKTQAEMGIVLGIDARTYRDYENGENVLPLKHALTLAEDYNCSLDWLYKLTDSSKEDDIGDINQKFIEDVRDIIVCKGNKILIRIKDSYWKYISSKNDIYDKRDTQQNKDSEIMKLNAGYHSEDNSITWNMVIEIEKEKFMSYYNLQKEEIPIYLEDDKGDLHEPTEEQLQEVKNFLALLTADEFDNKSN